MRKVTIASNNCLTERSFAYCNDKIGDRIIVPILYKRQITLVTVTITKISLWRGSPKGDVLVVEGFYNLHSIEGDRYKKKQIEISYF